MCNSISINSTSYILLTSSSFVLDLLWTVFIQDDAGEAREKQGGPDFGLHLPDLHSYH